MLRLMIAALLFAASPAMALETDCPLTDPENPSHRLVGAWAIGGSELDQTMGRRGDIWRITEHLEHWGERDQTLTCQYRGPNGGGRSIERRLPGLLISCDWLARDVLKPRPVDPGTGGPTETVFLRAWCTSRP